MRTGPAEEGNILLADAVGPGLVLLDRDVEVENDGGNPGNAAGDIGPIAAGPLNLNNPQAGVYRLCLCVRASVRIGFVQKCAFPFCTSSATMTLCNHVPSCHSVAILSWK